MYWDNHLAKFRYYIGPIRCFYCGWHDGKFIGGRCSNCGDSYILPRDRVGYQVKSMWASFYPNNVMPIGEI